jgi:uncharacterized protein (TIGR03437 family)
MKGNKMRTPITLATLLGASVFMPIAALAQTTVSCTAATLTGTRAITLTGRDVASSVLTKSFQSVGTAVFDGVSKVTLNLAVNTNVAPNTTQTWTGSYSLASNCVGTVSITTGDSATFTLIAYNTGNNFTLTGQDGTYSLAGSGAPMPVACATSSLSGNYVFSGNGFGLLGTGISGVNSISGFLQFNGRGAATGSATVVTSGSSAAVNLTGQYTINSACVASATFTDASGVAYTVALVPNVANVSDVIFDIATPMAQFSANGHAAFTNPGLAVASAASGASGATPPGSIFALYGSGLATSTAQPNSVPLPTMELTTTVTINGVAAPLFYVSPTQINAQMPLEVQPGVATVVVTNGSTMSNSVAVTVPGTATPGIFLYGSNRAVVQNPDFSLNSPTSPASVGQVVVAYLTGGGPVNAAGSLTTGHASPNGLSPVTESVLVTVGGVTAAVNYLGLTPTLVGLYQANIVVPQVAAGDRALVITIGGTASASALISVAN